jgi:hypothetical protein
MVFIETPIFTRQVVEALTDELYGLLQASLLGRPDAGDLIKGGGGIRKLRWACRAEENVAVFEWSTFGA